MRLTGRRRGRLSAVELLATPRELLTEIGAVRADAPRSAAPPTLVAEQNVQIVTLAGTPPPAVD